MTTFECRKGDSPLLAALAAGRDVVEAAKLAGISESTAHRRLKTPEFKAQVVELRAEMLSRAVGVLSAASAEAAETLLELARSATAETVRCSAARTILESGLKLKEAEELERRLAALEAAQPARQETRH